MTDSLRVAEPTRHSAFAADLKAYLVEAAARGVTESTLAVYRRDLVQYLDFLRSENVPALQTVDRAMIRRWLNELRVRGVAAASVERKAKLARAFMRSVLREDTDPFRGVRIRRSESPSRQVLSREELERLLDTPDGSAVGLRDRAAMAVLYAAGLRASDLVALDLRQVDVPGAQLLRWNAQGHLIPGFLGRTALRMLVEYVEQGRPRLDRKQGERALFLSQLGKRLSVRSVEHLVERHASASGLCVNPRVLRATCATHLREGGASAMAVRQLLGISLAGLPLARRL